ncbi:MAG: hypothetical protein HFI72_00535 [Peptococcaceae bacterium]|jgi:hypothetical protein|nr:hypothetical protein [Peptococcaceae bacterium]
MNDRVTCENIRCIFQIEGRCRSTKVVITDRGVCDSCYLLPVDKASLDKVKNEVDWEPEHLEYRVIKRKE